MIENLYNILCQQVIVDKDTELPSYIKCFDGVSHVKVPAKIPLLSLCTTWLVSPEKNKEILFKMRLLLKRPGKKKEVLFDVPERVIKKIREDKINFQLNGMPIKSFGEYLFIVEYKDNAKWKQAKVIVLRVNEKNKK